MSNKIISSITGFMASMMAFFGFSNLFSGKTATGQPQNNPMVTNNPVVGSAPFGFYKTIDEYRAKTFGKDYANNQKRKRKNRLSENYLK